MEKFTKFVAWLAAAVGVTSLISKAIEKWAERNGYLDDPGKGLAWALGIIKPITQHWMFWPVVAFLIGLALGFWLARLGKTARSSRELELSSIGLDQLSMANTIARRAHETYEPWPQCIADLIPSIESLLIRTRKAGVWAPPLEVLNLDEHRELEYYLTWVGRMLADGHYSEGRDTAINFKARIDPKLAPTPDAARGPRTREGTEG